MVTAPTNWTARHEAGSEFGLAPGAESSQFQKRYGHCARAIDRENRLRFRFDEENVVVLAAILVGARVGTPRRYEREPTIAACEIP